MRATLAFNRLTKKNKYLQRLYAHQGYLDEHLVERYNEKDLILDEDMFDWHYRQTIDTMILFYQVLSGQNTVPEKKNVKNQYIGFSVVKRRSCVGLRKKKKNLFAIFIFLG